MTSAATSVANASPTLARSAALNANGAVRYSAWAAARRAVHAAPPCAPGLLALWFRVSDLGLPATRLAVHALPPPPPTHARCPRDELDQADF